MIAAKIYSNKMQLFDWSEEEEEECFLTKTGSAQSSKLHTIKSINQSA